MECDVANFLSSLRVGFANRNIETNLDPALLSLIQDIPLVKEVTKLQTLDQKITPLEIIEVLQELLPSDAIVCADSGNNAVWLSHYLHLKDSQSFLIDINTGCMGSGVVSAIGAKLAAPHRPVFSVCGDGGFMMTAPEIATAADMGLDITWVVFNDEKLGMVEQGDNAKYGSAVGCRFKNANIAAIGKAYGANAVTVSSKEELREALANRTKGTSVIDIRFNDAYLPAVYSRTQAVPKKEESGAHT